LTAKNAKVSHFGTVSPEIRIDVDEFEEMEKARARRASG
jgi:hypothetical protein